MTPEEFEYLKTPQAQRIIEQYIEEDILKTAFKIRNSTIVTQIKNLQKCRSKLPAYYDARCIIPTISYQQSSSQATANLRNETGSLAIDLTCGLGVDALLLAQNFNQVKAVEIDSLRAEIARHNFALLGMNNIEVINTSAEDFLEEFSGKADLIYIDPSRRDESGRSIYAVEDCHPNVLLMQDKLRMKATKSIIKLSPLFDVQQCYRLFGDDAYCRVVTLNNECKEVLVELSDNKKFDLTVTAINGSEVRDFNFYKEQIGVKPSCIEIDPLYICVPDVGFYKSRTIAASIQIERYNFEGGYIFTENIPDNFCGTVYHITDKMPYQPKVLRKKFKQAIIHMKDFPYTVEQIGIKQGGSSHLFFASYNGERYVFVAIKV